MISAALKDSREYEWSSRRQMVLRQGNQSPSFVTRLSSAAGQALPRQSNASRFISLSQFQKLTHSRNSARTATAHTKMTPAQNAPGSSACGPSSALTFVTAIRPSLTRDSELRAAVLELVRCPNPVMDGLRIRETLKIVGFDVAQTEVLSVLQHLHDHGYITCEETLRPFVPLSDLARLSRIEITADGCGLVEDQQTV